MDQPAHVPELCEDSSASSVNGVSYFSPIPDVLGSPQISRIGPATACYGDGGCLGDDETRRSTLGVVLNHQFRRHVIAHGAPTR